MRYLGNKESIVDEIYRLLEDKGLINSNLTLFDCFCGSGSVADYLKGFFDTVIINDNLTWPVVYTHGRLCASQCTFQKLGFDPFVFLNTGDERCYGFIYKTYSPAESSRMYFTPENAARIDYFRESIESWWNDGLIDENEYHYLLACLIESVSDVSNTAGVYGAFLKKWDTRALKPIVFSRVDSRATKCNRIIRHNDKIENIISEIDCDVLYLDPPYTQNQYGTQYHLLETLVINDKPEVSRITGSRSTAPMRSDWSKEYKAHILFDRILAHTRARYVVLSYNNDGFLSKEFIEASMKRYGKSETYICRKISYKKYQNWKSANNREHFEYLFFIELKNKIDVEIESPLNYIGSKAKVIGDIKKYVPEQFGKFFDCFGGGFNVGINFRQKQVVYNDINHFVIGLVRSFREYDTYEYLLYIRRTIARFGLEKTNQDAYIKARAYYNATPEKDRDPRLLYTIILYGYQQQIRFNSNHEFNNPVGMRWFNDKVLEKMISFSRAIKENEFVFYCLPYTELQQYISKDDFVYFDPPYRLTTGAYNDGKRGFNGWNDEQESELFNYCNQLTKQGIRFMLSYVIEHRGKRNEKLVQWANEHAYRIIALGDILGISGSRRKEVLIINYDV